MKILNENQNKNLIIKRKLEFNSNLNSIQIRIGDLLLVIENAL